MIVLECRGVEYFFHLKKIIFYVLLVYKEILLKSKTLKKTL